MNERGNPSNNSMVDLSPKDIKQLEVLRPHSIPSMRERHKASLEKEKHLVAANRPPQSSAKQAKKEVSNQMKKEEIARDASRSKGKSKKRRETTERYDEKVSQDALDQDDEVEEFVDWSDDE
jgi:hypothetical protein